MSQMVQVKTNFNTEIEVADIKKDVIENIIEAAGVCIRICQIILFGSVNREFLKRLHDKDDYEQMYDVICVHGMEEIYQYQDTVSLFRDVIDCGKTLYKRA